MSRPLRLAVLACGLAGAMGSSWGQAGIYTCVDAKGRRLTSDRPILECVDREQKELNASGTVRRIVPPSLTGPERAVLEERERRAAEDRQRLEEERRLQRALLVRYPNQAVHDSERAKALATAQEAIATGHRRIAELQEQRKALDTEAQFHKSPAQWPAKLKRQVEDNEQHLASQQRQVALQEDEKKRVDARFSDELARLKALWARAHTTAVATQAQAPVAPVRR
jgi:hypothetical protein